ncbi:MAG: hypothetical protein AB8F34_11890 [Akkermansiaceae bacterium]
MKTTLKNRIGISFALILAALPLAVVAADQSGLNHEKKQNVRMMRNEDGSITKFSRSSDNRVLERRTYGERPGGNGERVLRMCIIYRKDVHGRLRTGKVYDGGGAILYRVMYGYHRETGRLVAENMYDARVKRTAVINGVNGRPAEIEKPVRRLFYQYDAQGRPTKPIVFCLPAGKRAEQLFGKDKGTWTKDPFENK